MTINQKQKGARVEREVAAWLRGLGVASARRTEQYCGAVGDGDIIADELPSFHIESKGTKKNKLPKSMLLKWYNQVMFDTKDGHLPVIFNSANNTDIVALVPVEAALKMNIWIARIKAVIGDSFTPIIYVNESKLYKAMMQKLVEMPENALCTTAFRVEEGKELLAFQGDEFVKAMLEYERFKKEKESKAA